MTLLSPSSTFKILWSLTVTHCNRMQNLITSSTAKSLGCEMMIEVFANEGNIERDEIVFKNLQHLFLFNLESLTLFGSGNYNLKFPSLVSLIVSKCSKMKTFFNGGLNLPKLREW